MATAIIILELRNQWWIRFVLRQDSQFLRKYPSSPSSPYFERIQKRESCKQIVCSDRLEQFPGTPLFSLLTEIWYQIILSRKTFQRNLCLVNGKMLVDLCRLCVCCEAFSLSFNNSNTGIYFPRDKKKTDDLLFSSAFARYYQKNSRHKNRQHKIFMVLIWILMCFWSNKLYVDLACILSNISRS